MGSNEGVVAVLVGAVVLMILGAIVAGSPGGRSGSVSLPQQSGSISIDSSQAPHLSQKEINETGRRVDRIAETIDLAEEQLNEIDRTVHETQKALDDIKRNAQAAHVGGQMNDFQMWQRIGREKKSSLDEALRTADNLIADARRGAESELQGIDAGSSTDKDRHMNQINQRISGLEIRASGLEGLVREISQSNSWLEATE